LPVPPPLCTFPFGMFFPLPFFLENEEILRPSPLSRMRLFVVKFVYIAFFLQMTRVHGSPTRHAGSGASHSPNMKHIHVGEEEVPIPLFVDDEGPIVTVPLEEEEVVPVLLAV
jgi:hypothetical protein